jgi:hypothetical protein
LAAGVPEAAAQEPTTPFGTPLPGHAAGGDYPPDQPFWAGEKGPELVFPKTSGTVIPNDKIAAGTGLNHAALKVFTPPSVTGGASPPPNVGSMPLTGVGSSDALLAELRKLNDQFAKQKPSISAQQVNHFDQSAPSLADLEFANRHFVYQLARSGRR